MIIIERFIKDLFFCIIMSQEKPNIICIDDEKGVRAGFKYSLNVPQDNIFDNYKDGIDRLSSPDLLCDLVITDLSPNPADFSRNGITVLDAAVQTYDDLPCIVYTGNAKENDNPLVQKAKTYANTHILGKPCNLTDLRGLVSKLLAEHHPKKKEMKKSSVFVVEDEQPLYHLLEIYLNNKGYILNMDKSCRTSLSQIKHLKPDVLVLDVMNDKYHGDDLLENLFEQGYRIPTIIMSGTPYEKEVIRAIYHTQRMYSPEQRESLSIPFNEWPGDVNVFQSGNPFMLKPFSPSELIKYINKVLEVTKGSI
jgi:DNA-binding NtrC family response regulator